MRIGLSGGAASIDRIVEQAQRAEADGFSSLWYASAVFGDPLAAMAVAGHATKSIELGTSVLQTYTSHPILQWNRATSTANAMGRPGFTMGIGPSHAPVVEGMFGMSYDKVGQHTEEYVQLLTGLLSGEAVDMSGEFFTTRMPATAPPTQPVSVLVSALAPRLLRVAGEMTDGTILWMGNARSIDLHVAPRITKAASNAGRPAPRIVAGLPCAVTDDEAAGRESAAKRFAGYGLLPNYRRILDLGAAPGPGDAAIVGDEASVTAQIQALFDAGATDVWCEIFPVGEDKPSSRKRTRDLLQELANA